MGCAAPYQDLGWDAGMGQSSQWVELWAAWMVTVLKAATVTLWPNGWAIFKGLTLWFPTRATNECMGAKRLL